MIIYNQEKQDGIEEIILAKASTTFDCPVKPSERFQKAIAAKNISRDIFTIESILASVGWNANDDVFSKEQMWLARSTAINKKFNYMHNEKDIIGHIISAIALNEDGEVIPDDTPIDEVPDFFEISVGSVVYSVWEDKDLQERATNLMSEIAEDKWFVSMEVLFPDFDYALSKGDEQVIIERNEESSFLTKYLRVYNGKGEYEGWKVGRQLKDMFFSGKGLVDNPANKRSLITSINFNGAKASTSIFNEVKMATDQKEYDKAIADLAVAKSTVESVESNNKLLSEKIVSLENDIESAKAVSADYREQIEAAQKTIKEQDAKILEVNKSLAEVLETAKANDRVSTLVSEGVEKTKAEEVVSKFAKASDEMFAEVVELYKSKQDSAKAAESAKASEEDKVEDETKKLDSTKAEENEKEEVKQVAPQDESDKLLEASAAFISGFINKNKKGDQ